MSKIYTIEYLEYLRNSPLVLRPPGLPPIEQWMGLTTDSTNSLTRRSLLDKHSPPRNNANSEEQIHIHPKNSSISATSIRNLSKNANSPDRSGIQETSFGSKSRIKVNEVERGHDSRINLLRSKRLESEKSKESWSGDLTRKSFGGEDAERFINRPGGDKARDDRGFKDREDQEGKERSWGSNTFNREKVIDNDQHRERNHRSSGTGRGRNESSWFKEKDNDLSLNSKSRHTNENYVDRSRGWRGREKDERVDTRAERFTDKLREKSDHADRRWERTKDHRHKNEPEWMEDPGEERHQVHTSEDFEKWKEQMQGKDKIVKSQAEDKDHDFDKFISNEERTKVETPLDFDPGPDKFLDLNSSKGETFSDSVVEAMSEGTIKSTASGKASRFTSFFTTQEEPQKNYSEYISTTQQCSPSPMKSNPNISSQSEAEKEAFQQLLQKLQRQTLQASSSVTLANVSSQLQPSISEKASSAKTLSQEIYQNYSNEYDEGRPNTRLSQQAFQDLFSQRQMAESQNVVRPEQMLQELISQRQNALGQNSSRSNQNSPRNTNTEFLMGLMQSGRSAPESQRTEPIHLEMQSKSDQRQIPKNTIMDLEQEIKREKMAHPDRTRPHPPPGFFEDSSFTRGSAPLLDRQPVNSQPTQMLQRPPPPGLDLSWERQAQLPHPQNRHVQNLVPPPGLTSNLNRVMPIPQQAFLPGFTMGSFPPPDVMSVSPQNIQMQPPPGFFNGPPHGFLPPAMGGFQGPENLAYGAAPFDGRRLHLKVLSEGK
ncbi:hypothetical protein EPUL_002202 [Erysiphe pulchra]|uniref:Uncharacterized protein n=1 Tax=Erysiphe pulchra TaxID=225359 RepID=A0A2S4PYS0_9PEZI|nr:hypothetical protein EPUL_002202 [Erysiphe pulchra]